MIHKLLISIIWLYIFNMTAYSQGDWELLIPSGTSNQMSSLYFIDQLNGWSVGAYGTITKTSDGGNSWVIVEIDYLTQLTDVCFPSKSVGYIVGEDGLILKTSNGGDTWEKLDNAFSNNLYRVKFRDEARGWIIGENGLILYTTNGGDTWNQQTSGSRAKLSGIEFIDEQHVCIAGSNQTILLSGDNGENWHLIDNDFYSGDLIFNFSDVYFADDSTGWACGNSVDQVYGGWPGSGFIARTFDGGANWYLLEIDRATYVDIRGEGGVGGGIYPLQQIYFKDDQTTGLGMVAGGADRARNFPLYTRNEGRTWRAFIEGYNESYTGKGRFQFISDSGVVATGYHGDFRFSDDSGSNWYFKNKEFRFWDDFQIGPDNTLHVIHRKPVWDEPYDLVENYEFKHLISEDHGRTWNEVSSTIHFSDGSTAEIDTVFYRNMTCLGRMTRTPGSRLYTFFQRNKHDTTSSVLYSDDMGINYFELRSGIQSVGSDLSPWQFLTPDTLIYSDLSYDGKTLYCKYSFDGGTTIVAKAFNGVWNNITSGSVWYPAFINDCYFFNGHTGFLVGDDGNILKTEDTGRSWTNIFSRVVEDLWDIEFLNLKIGFVVGNFGRILKTEDGGNTWRKTNSGTQEDIYSIAFLNDTEGWVGTRSGMRYTNDGGETWHGVALRYQHGAVHNINFDHQGNGYAYTLCSDINKYWDTEIEYSGSYVLLQRMLNGTTALDNPGKSRQPDVEQIILYPNYPNPFNTRTSIKYYLQKSGIVSLKVFNIQGQLVRTLVKQSQESGYHSIVWDGYSDLGRPVSSGVYLYQLRFNGQTRNRKLILLK